MSRGLEATACSLLQEVIKSGFSRKSADIKSVDIKSADIKVRTYSIPYSTTVCYVLMFLIHRSLKW
jgi:hypothetical protein